MDEVAAAMVDTERAATVQTLRALFSQQPVMGLLQSPKMSCTLSVTSAEASRENPPVHDNAISDASHIVSSPTQEKPPIKPKPTVAQRSPTCNGQSAVKTMVANLDREFSSSKSSSSSSICEVENANCDKRGAVNARLVKKETIVTCSEDDMEVALENCVVMLSENGFGESQDSSVESGKIQMKRKVLPLVDKLGPAPLKPSLPKDVDEKYRTIRMSKSPQPPPLPRRNTVDDIPPPVRPPSVHLPSRPMRPPPTVSMIRTPPSRPPPAPPVVPEPASTSPEVEELYGDTAEVDESERPSSLIPEYSEDDELGKRDSAPPMEIPSPPSHPPPARPKLPPPPPPPIHSPSNKTSSPVVAQDEVQNVSSNSSDQEIYEAIPADEQQEQQGPIYSNTKEQEKQQRDQQKQMRREQKEREKKERENEKEKKKFGLTGEEVPIYVGCVKNDSRGGRNDLAVRKGEIVLILRIEKNPIGKWLAKNEKGKRGYVELTNIEVDADSVKSVMKSRMSISLDDVYSDVKAEDVEDEESVYECTF